MQNSLTSGNVFKNIVRFSLPYLLSYFMQTLYGMADLYIVGQFDGVDSITAVSIGSQVMHMVTVMIVGLAMGATVTIGQAIGAGKKDTASDSVGNTITMFLWGSVAAAAALILCVNGIVSLMSTPAKAVADTKIYLTICFAGIPFITAYNIISSIFRGMGDSKSPMYFIGIACVSNILLDYIFIGVMGLGSAGAALGTTISQTISVAVSAIIILKRKTGLVLKRSSFRIQRDPSSRILKIGIPVALQDGFIQISFLIITIIANRRGLNDAAAVGIVEKIIGMLFLVPSSMLSAVSALAAQNIGAGKPDRAVKTLRYAIIICVSFGALAVFTIQLLAKPVISLFADSPEVVLLGSQYIRGYIFDCIFAGIHFCFSGYFCACAKSGISFLHNVLSIILVRIPGAYLMSTLFPDTLFPMGIAVALGSVLSSVICVIFYWTMRREIS